MHVEERRLVAAFTVGLLTAQDRMTPMSNSWKTATAHWGRDGQNISKSEFSSCYVCDCNHKKHKTKESRSFVSEFKSDPVHEESILKTILGFCPSDVW